MVSGGPLELGQDRNSLAGIELPTPSSETVAARASARLSFKMQGMEVRIELVTEKKRKIRPEYPFETLGRIAPF